MGCGVPNALDLVSGRSVVALGLVVAASRNQRGWMVGRACTFLVGTDISPMADNTNTNTTTDHPDSDSDSDDTVDDAVDVDSSRKRIATYPKRFAPLAEWSCLELVDDRLEGFGTHGPEETALLRLLAGRLEELLDPEAPEEGIDTFLGEAASWGERLDRWAALHSLARLAHLPELGTVWPGWDGPEGRPSCRPLRPLELATVAIWSRASDHEALIGSMVGGVDSGELAVVMIDDIGLDASGSATSISCPGEKPDRPGPAAVAPREIAIPVWARRAFDHRRAVVAIDPARPFFYRGSQDERCKVQSSLLMKVGVVLARAGLKGDPTVKPRSIRNGAARLVAERDGIEAAAAMTGVEDLGLLQRYIGKAPARYHRR